MVVCYRSTSKLIHRHTALANGNWQTQCRGLKKAINCSSHSLELWNQHLKNDEPIWWRMNYHMESSSCWNKSYSPLSLPATWHVKQAILDPAISLPAIDHRSMREPSCQLSQATIRLILGNLGPIEQLF